MWFNGVMKMHLNTSPNCDDLAPPLDIAWIWHVHTLSPVEYFKTCNSIFHKPADRTKKHFSFAEARSNRDVRYTIQLWKKATKENFILNIGRFSKTKVSKKDKAKASISSEQLFLDSLKQAAKSQLEFLYQIDRPEYMNDLFLQESEIRYWKFIELIACSNSAFVVPTYDIDFIWHTHMACTKSYRESCLEIAGSIINHDFSDSDRSPDSKLVTFFPGYGKFVGTEI